MPKFKFIPIVISLILSYSCSTALKPLTETKAELKAMDKCEMGFIGFKNLKVSKKMFSTFLEEITSAKIADDMSSYYSGDFSLNEISLLQDDAHRYATYIDVSKFYYTHNDNIDYKDGLEIAAWVVASCTVFTLFPVYVPMFCCASKNTTQVSLVGELDIVVFDLKTKQCICTVPVNVEKTDYCSGKYGHRKTDRNKVDLYYQTILSNALIEGYKKVQEKLETFNPHCSL